jgi:hypothetical protein
MGSSQVFGDDQIEFLTERLCCAVTEQGRGGTIPAPDRSGRSAKITSSAICSRIASASENVSSKSSPLLSA